jgi:two-component sensor histidine kinase
MSIKTKLRIVALAPLLMALVVGMVTLFAREAMLKAQQHGRTAERLIQSMNDLHSLVGLYLLHHEERPREQFLAEHNAATRLLATAGFSDTEQQQLLDNLRENTGTIKEIFLRMIATYERRQSNPDAQGLGWDEERLAGQLMVRSRQAMADGLHLETLVKDGIAATQARINLLILLLILIVTLPLTFLLFRMTARISRSISTLQRGTEVLGVGNLAHRVRLGGEDELAGLSRAFDRMTENLQAVTVSKNELEREVEERKRAEASLQTSLREREVLLKEIHHRVKNNMQVISSLVSFQSDAIDDPAVRSVFDDLRGQVRTMALVHEKLYQSESLARIDFAEYARGLSGYLERMYGSAASNVRVTFDVDPVLLSVETAVPCGLILNELASNAFKHAFRDGRSGEISISLHSNADGRVCLGVGDNGIGLPADMNWRELPSLGLQIVQMLAGQLQGQLDVCTDNGTAFCLTFSPPALKQEKDRAYA